MQSAQGAAEGGLGKIWLELGAPGFVVITWLGWAFARHIWDILKFVSRQSMPLKPNSLGLSELSHCQYRHLCGSDPSLRRIFILLLLGTALGALLAMPVLADARLCKSGY